MKKVAILLTAAFVMAVLFPLTALAAVGDTGADGNFSWREVDGAKVEVTGYLGTDTIISVPGTLNGMPVVGIAKNGFSGKPFTSVTIPAGVKYLGEAAFAGCTSLTGVTLPDSVETFGDGCFYQCTALGSITLPESLKSLGESVFSACTNLKTVVMQNNVTTMGNGTFNGCTKLENVTLSNRLELISSNAFNGCSSLQNITIPGSVKLIGTSAFISSGLTGIDIPGSVKTIDIAAFNSIKTLTSLTLHSGLETIGNFAFTSCTNLGQVTIPETVTTLGENEFAGCTSLNKAVILAETFSYTGFPFGGDPLSDGIYGFAGFTAEAIASGLNKTFHPLSKITYDSQSGSAVPWGYAVTNGTVDALPSPPERQGYVFGGWWTAINGGGTQFTAATPVAGGITVYAKWTPVLALIMLPADGKIYIGDTVAITPNIDGGTWSFDAAYLSRDGSNFTGLKDGSVRVTYTALKQTKYVDVVITKKLALAMSPADGKIYTGDKVTITPNIDGGTWSFDTAYLSRDGNNFTGLKEGSVRVTYTAGEQSKYADVVITKKLALAMSPADGKVLTGGTVMITPNVDGGTWTFDASYLSRDGNNFTGLKEGSVRVTYTAGEQSKYADVVITRKLALSASISDGKIYSSGRIKITPNIEGGTWSFDASYLSRDGNTFTGIKAGTVRVTYAAGGQTAVFDITIVQSELPKTGQDGIWVWILAGAGLMALGTGIAIVLLKRRPVVK